VKLPSKPMIKSFDFLQAWRTAASNRSAQLLSSWTDYKLYTSLILNNPTCLLVDVGNALGLEAYPRDYYAVDGLLYSQQDFVPGCPKGQFWFRSLSVAFEHENTFNRNVFQEIAHLLILRARLSVVVTYTPIYDQELMNYFHSIIQPCHHASELDLNESFLMILGRRDPLEWDGYVYKKEGWKKL
ncbi:MAG: hypothetical protein ACOYOE_14865, partial [Chlorobium sp.]